METVENLIIKKWNKIELNSCYYPLSSNIVVIFDKSLNEKITEESKKELSKIQKSNKLF